MTPTDEDLSRAVSHALRHEPWLYELELDEGGWVPVDQLLVALHDKGGDWRLVDREGLLGMLGGATKRRHEIDGDRIRALYGHSLPGGITKHPAAPPARLFHGTSSEAWAEIEKEGLLPMGRQFVHLSVDRGTAVLVGHRKSASPVLLRIDAGGAAKTGAAFYQGNEQVWLADRVPAGFIDVVQ